MRLSMDKCKECKQNFENKDKLHKHLRSHGLTIEKYYKKHYPRKDFLTGEFIKFKSYDFYFNNDFNNKNNLRKWLLKQPLQVAKKYSEQLLKNRIEKKKLKFLPSQVELRTITMPSVILYKRIFKNYYELCNELNVDNRWGNFTEEDYKRVLRLSKKKPTILVDTREQLPFEFDVPTKSIKLDYGDYCLEDSTSKPQVFIERKTLKDFVSTFSGGFERFKRELDKATSNNAFLVVVVESSLNDCLSFRFNKALQAQCKWKVTADFVFHNVRELLENNNNIQFLFTKDREEASKLSKIILCAECLHTYADLQLIYDERILR